jgi:hypothetical protein
MPFFLLLAFSSCRDDGGPEDGRVVDRVLLVYLGGDSNLSGEVPAKIEALQAGRRAGDGPVILYVDDARARGSCLLRLAGDAEAPLLDTLAVYEEENSASPAVLRRVVEQVRERFPARGYGLLLFSHASGWLPAGTLQEPLAGLSRSLIVDDGEGARREMELAAFAAALPDGMFDFIVFETCLTANVELVHALRRKAEYIVASAAEIVSPGFTPLYPDALVHLLATRGELAAHLGAFAERYVHHASGSVRYLFSATISVIHTAALDELASVTREIYRQAPSFTDFEKLQRFDRPGQYSDTPALARYFDLDQYVEQIASPAGYERFREVLARVVLYEGHSARFLLYAGGPENPENGFEITRHGGLTTYVERPEFPFINAGYRATSWYGATR